MKLYSHDSQIKKPEVSIELRSSLLVDDYKDINDNGKYNIDVLTLCFDLAPS